MARAKKTKFSSFRIVGSTRLGSTRRVRRTSLLSGCSRPSSKITWKKKQVPIKSLSSPITKRQHHPSILSLPNDVLACILRKALETSPVSVHGKRIQEITTPSTLSDVCFTFKSLIEQTNLTEVGGVKHIDLATPFPFFRATEHSSTPSFADTFVKSEKHRFIGNSLTTAILHPRMPRDVQHSLLTQISRSAGFLRYIAFTDGYGYDLKGIPSSMSFTAEMELSQLTKLTTIQVNLPSLYLIKLLCNAFCNVKYIGLLGIHPSDLTEVLHLVRSRHYRSDETINLNCGNTLPSCCKLNSLQLSVKLPLTNYPPERNIEVEKIRDFVKLISTNLRAFSALKWFTFRVDNAPEVMDEMACKMRRSRSSGIVPINCDITLLANGKGKYINFARRLSPASAHRWFCEMSTNIYYLITQAKKDMDVREVERHICKSGVMDCGIFNNVHLYYRMKSSEKQWIMSTCKEYGKYIKELRVADLQRKTNSLQFETICSFVHDMTMSLPSIRGLSMHWSLFDHFTNEQGILSEKDIVYFAIICPHKIEWFEIIINDDHTPLHEWKQQHQFADKFVSILPLFIQHLVSYRRSLRSIIISKQAMESLPLSDRSAVQKAISSIEDIEKKNPLLDLSSVRNYLVAENSRPS